MTREQAVKLCHETLIQYGLKDWHVRLTTKIDGRTVFLGMCVEKDKCIILNALHIDTHPDVEIVDTIKHEIAHAIVGCDHQHDDVWAEKAKELGAIPRSCSSMGFSMEAIDAIRSGADVEVTFEEETVVFRKPKYQITRLQDKCPTCGKVAVTVKDKLITISSEIDPDIRLIFLECGHIITKKIPKGTPFHLLISGGKKDCTHAWVKNTCDKCGAHKPYDFQTEGMRFIEQALAVNKGAAVFDEMGLGKTIQALGYINFHRECWPVLYVVKSGIRFQWLKQINTWIQHEDHLVQVIEKSTDILLPGMAGYVISYDILVPKTRKKKDGSLSQQGFSLDKIKGKVKLVVLDECQQIKNVDSTRTQQVRRIVGEMGVNVIALSGTPWKNRGSELFPVLNMIAPRLFSSNANFINYWVDRWYEGNRMKEGGIKPGRLLEFKNYIKDIAIRRERTEVMSELPTVNRTKLQLQMTQLEQDEYDDEVSAFVTWYNEQVIEGRELNSINILAKMSRMRHLTGLAKIPTTMEFVDEFVESNDRKLVVFVHHQDVGQLIYTQLKEAYGDDINILQITSAMSGEDRFNTQELFNGPKRAIMVASTIAAGEGLNLQTCADCILHERQWNPANEEQAEGRFIRIGQLANFVNATYIEASDSIDEHFDGIVEHKRHAFHGTMNKGEAPQWNPNDIAKELAAVIVANFNRKNRKKAS